MKEYICDVCGHIHKGDGPPDVCPMCFALKSHFVEKTEESMKELAHLLNDI
ncbi:rubredoxin-like domain-containing protein [Fusibacter sp. JL216-2]|uniref:rubredoxin-like domain-containing protein n=1 Tax=Fusibacter sp. JL216-2 TaxID=3071453 RepID=UPI003D34DFF3